MQNKQEQDLQEYVLLGFNTDSVKQMLKSLALFEDYLVQLVHAKRQREGSSEEHPVTMMIVNAASGDKSFYQGFFQVFNSLQFNNISTSFINLTKNNFSAEELKEKISSADLLFINGGNTVNMIDIFKEKLFLKAITELRANAFPAEDEISLAEKVNFPILTGVSAGVLYLFDQIITDSDALTFKEHQGINWLPGSFCVHAVSSEERVCEINGEKASCTRFSTFEQRIKAGLMNPGIALPDNCLLHYRNQNLVAAISTVPNNSYFYVTAEQTEKILMPVMTSENIIRYIKNIFPDYQPRTAQCTIM